MKKKERDKKNISGKIFLYKEKEYENMLKEGRISQNY